MLIKPIAHDFIIIDILQQLSVIVEWLKIKLPFLQLFE